MAKIVSEQDIDTITCPGCKANIEIEREKPTHRIIEHDHEDHELDRRLNNIEKMLDSKRMEPEKKPKKEEILPSFVPGYVCKDCGDVHKNKGYKKKAKFRCANGDCGQFSPTDKAKCPWCGSSEWDALDEEVLGMLPEPPEHDHGDE